MFTELRMKVNNFSGRKSYLTELKIRYVKFQNYAFMKIKRYFMKDKNLCLKKPHTLGALNCQFSSNGGGDFMQLCVLRNLWSHFWGRDLIFGVQPHISIYFTDIKYFFFNLNHLEPAPGRQAPELEVKALKIVKLDVLEQAPGYIN